jgi:two-component system, NarL family, sensor histidine kinase DegS
MSVTPAGGGDAGSEEGAGAASQRSAHDERAVLGRELDEIELLLTQARSEAERHELRRRQAAERLEQLLATAPPELREGHDQLLRQTQRATLMSAQIEVLEGKQKVLRRYAASLDAERESGAPGQLTSRGASPAAAETGQASSATQSRDVLAAQEDMRRLIARQMHDGPAQSIANIALQAQVVQRLLERDPAAAGRELDELRRMVQHALEATKTFIFDVRPMVLDDLGLLPTLRRAARERSQRSGIPVDLESHGQDRRLEPEIESSLFRILDDTLAGYVGARPAAVRVRVDWMEDRVTAAVQSEPPPEPQEKQTAPPASLPPGADVPPALAGMIESRASEQVERAATRRRGFALDDELWKSLEARARTVDIALVLSDDGLRVEAACGMPSASGSG